MWVYGNSERDVLVAVVVPDPGMFFTLFFFGGGVVCFVLYTDRCWCKEVLLPWAKSSDIKSVCASKEAEALIFHDFARLASEAKLAGFERIARIHLEPIEWTADSVDLMTPTMKTKVRGLLMVLFFSLLIWVNSLFSILQRPGMQKHYQKVIDGLYADLNPEHLRTKPKAKL